MPATEQLSAPIKARC